MTLSRRRVLALGAALPFAAAWAPVAAEPDASSLRALVRAGIQRDGGGAVSSVFGLDPDLAADVLLRATKADALPTGYAPADLASVRAAGLPEVGGQLLRALVMDDTRALVDAASDDGVEVYVGSGYRSQSYQIAVFAAQVQRWGDPETANHYSAAPGHSQHQLGTTIDFTDTFAAFRRGPGPDWLHDNAHRFGFLLPYTTASVPLTGYADEPWHARWVGVELASRLQALGYQEWQALCADDVVSLVRDEAALDMRAQVILDP